MNEKVKQRLFGFVGFSTIEEIRDSRVQLNMSKDTEKLKTESNQCQGSKEQLPTSNHPFLTRTVIDSFGNHVTNEEHLSDVF